MLTYASILVALLIVGFIMLQRAGGGNFPWIQFYAKGKESGFSFKEINLLRKVAVEIQLENPISLFWSIKTLDRSIRGMILKFRSENREDDPEADSFLTKLFDFRKRVELDLPKYTIGLKTTRKISTHQRLKLTLPGLGTFTSSVVENLRRYMAISYPEGPTLPQGFSWKGQKVNAYFWRTDDAGYVFESRVIEDFFGQKYPILHIAHSENLIRSQKRSSVRVDTNKLAYLYALRSIHDASEEEELQPGLKCQLIDLSEDGSAVLIGGKARVGLPIKIQFNLNAGPIVMNGVVRGVTYNQKKHQSILHVKAVPPSHRTKNRILMYVYNIFNEREELVTSNVKSALYGQS
jgi:c-di-GMP-binding flagellar brake protein YcgR